MNKSIGFICLLIFFMMSCSVGNHTVPINDANHVNKAPNSIPMLLTIKVIPHGDNRYYTNTSDTQNYIAVNIKNPQGIRTPIKYTNPDNPSFIIVESTVPNIYKINKCESGVLAKGAECELIYQAIGGDNSSESAISIINNQTNYYVNLHKSTYLYLSGSFSQIFINGESALSEIRGGSCGNNKNMMCPIIQYDLINKTTQVLAYSESDFQAMAIDNNSNLYVSGMGSKIYSPTNQMIASTGNLNLKMIAKISTNSNNNISDFISSTNTLNGYPNGAVTSMEFNNNNLYINGDFNQIGNINEQLGYPLCSYNLMESSWNNILGAGNNPDASINAIKFDKNGNLYIGGLYQKIGNNTFATANNRALNKCTYESSSKTYVCNKFDSYGNILYSNTNDTITSIALDKSNNIYTGGEFNQFDYIYNSQPLEISVAGYTPIIFGLLDNNFQNINWNTNNNFYLNNTILNILAYTNTKGNNALLVNGYFADINGNLSDNNVGICGSNINKSCLLAEYDTQLDKWSPILTTNNVISNAIVGGNQLTATIR